MGGGDRHSEPLSRSSSSHPKIGWGLWASAYSSAVSCLLCLCRLHHRTPPGSGSWPTALALDVRWLGLQPNFWSRLSAGHFRSSTLSSYICGWQKAAMLLVGPSQLHCPASVLGGCCSSALLGGLPPFRRCSLWSASAESAGLPLPVHSLASRSSALIKQ